MADRSDILFTGFDAFGLVAQNTSDLVVSALSSVVSCECLILPTSYERSVKNLRSRVQELKPRVLIMTGHASNVDGVRIESLARSLVTTTSADNDGQSWSGRNLGELAHLPVTLDVARVAKVLRAAGMTVTTSDSAGGYVCNALLYNVLADPWPELQECGFLHVGKLESVGGSNSLTDYVEAFRNLAESF